MSFKNARNFVVNDLQQWDIRIEASNSGSSACQNGFELLQGSIAPGALHNSGERFDPPKCYPNTRTAVLKKINTWSSDTLRSSRIMWLYGPAGAGKSAIAQTVAEQRDECGELAASFFFSRSSFHRNTDKFMLTTIAYQMALSIPEMRPFIEKAVETDPVVVSKSMEAQLQALIIDPLILASRAHSDLAHSWPELIIIDGLDECKGEEEQCNILRAISSALLRHRRLRLCFIIASRPEPHIREMFNRVIHSGLSTCLVLDNSFHPAKDIERFLRGRFDKVKNHHQLRRYIPKTWPSDKDIATLVTRSSGQFIYASTVVKYIDDSRHRPTSRLKIVLGVVPTGSDMPFAQLDALYKHILSRVKDIKRTLLVIGTLLLLADRSGDASSQKTLKSPAFIDQILTLDSGETFLLLSDLHSIFFVPTDSPVKSEIRVFHASLGDFMMDHSRSGEYFIEGRYVHTQLALRCLKAYNPVLRHPIYPYSSRFLFHHLSRSRGTKELLHELDKLDLPALIKININKQGASIKATGGVMEETKMDLIEATSWHESQNADAPAEQTTLRHILVEAFDKYHCEVLGIYPQDGHLLVYLALFSFAVTYAGVDWILEELLRLAPEMAFSYISADKRGLRIMLLKDEVYKDWFLHFLRNQDRSGKYHITGDVHAEAALVLLKCIFREPRAIKRAEQFAIDNVSSHLSMASSSIDLRNYIRGQSTTSRWTRISEQTAKEACQAIASYLKRVDDYFEMEEYDLVDKESEFGEYIEGNHAQKEKLSSRFRKAWKKISVNSKREKWNSDQSLGENSDSLVKSPILSRMMHIK